MELLSQIIIPRPEGDAFIQLLQGDLTAIPEEMAVDILAVSAFQGSYEPFSGTLMASLFDVGISVAELAKDKEINLLTQLSCWLSKPLGQAQQERLHFKKILCFEPAGGRKSVETEVGNLFRGINTFAIDEQHNEIAMPILATGNQQFPIETMLPALLDTALFWLESGLPLKSLKFVLYSDEKVKKGLPIFEAIRKQYELKHLAMSGQMSANRALAAFNKISKTSAEKYSLPKLEFSLQELAREEKPNTREVRDINEVEPAPISYDYFISYSHRHTAAVQELVRALQTRNPALTIFYDRDSIPTGGLWIKMISDAIQNSKNVICILTPEYSKSDVCWDEFQCAYIMEKRKKLMIKTINFCNDADLPPMIAIRSYIDCTEGDLEKLKGAVETLLTPF